MSSRLIDRVIAAQSPKKGLPEPVVVPSTPGAVADDEFNVVLPVAASVAEEPRRQQRPERRGLVDQNACRLYDRVTKPLRDVLIRETPLDDKEPDISKLSYLGKRKRLERTDLKPKGISDPTIHEESRVAARALLVDDLALVRTEYDSTMLRYETDVPAVERDKLVRVGDRIESVADAMKRCRDVINTEQAESYQAVKRWILAQVEGIQQDIDSLTIRQHPRENLANILDRLTAERVDAWQSTLRDDLSMVRSAILDTVPTAATGRIPRSIMGPLSRIERSIQGSLMIRVRIKKPVEKVAEEAADVSKKTKTPGEKEEIVNIDIRTLVDITSNDKLRAQPELMEVLQSAIDQLIHERYDQRKADLGSDAVALTGFPELERLNFFDRKDLLLEAVIAKGTGPYDFDKQPLPYPNKLDLKLGKGNRERGRGRRDDSDPLSGVSFTAYAPDVIAKINRLRAFDVPHAYVLPDGTKHHDVELNYMRDTVALVWGSQVAAQIEARTMALPVEHIYNIYQWFLERAEETVPEDKDRYNMTDDEQRLTKQKGQENVAQAKYEERLTAETKVRRIQLAEAFRYVVKVEVGGVMRNQPDEAVISALAVEAEKEAPFLGEFRRTLNLVRRFLGPEFVARFKDTLSKGNYTFPERAYITEKLSQALADEQRHMESKRKGQGNEAWKKLMGDYWKISEALRAQPNLQSRDTLARDLQEIFLKQVKLTGTAGIDEERLGLIISKINARKEDSRDIFSELPLDVEDDPGALRKLIASIGEPDRATGSATGDAALRATFGDQTRPAAETTPEVTVEPLRPERTAPLLDRLEALFPDEETDKPVYKALMEQFNDNRPPRAREALRVLEQLTTLCERAAKLYAGRTNVVWMDAVNFLVEKADEPGAMETEPNNMRLLIVHLAATPNLTQAGDVFAMTSAYAEAAIPDNAGGKALQGGLGKLGIVAALDDMVRGLLLSPVMDRPDVKVIGVLDKVRGLLATPGKNTGLDLLRDFELINADGDFDYARFVEVVATANSEK